MIEAVGHQFYDTYFRQCGRLLKHDGLMLLQAITIADQRYEQARKSVDFIQRHIFPGSTIPSVTAMLDATTRASDLKLAHLEDIGPHYATTLRVWRENFLRNLDAVRALGYPESSSACGSSTSATARADSRSGAWRRAHAAGQTRQPARGAGAGAGLSCRSPKTGSKIPGTLMNAGMTQMNADLAMVVPGIRIDPQIGQIDLRSSAIRSFLGSFNCQRETCHD